jgi:hypothetical protein
VSIARWRGRNHDGDVATACSIVADERMDRGT